MIQGQLILEHSNRECVLISLRVIVRSHVVLCCVGGRVVCGEEARREKMILFVDQNSFGSPHCVAALVLDRIKGRLDIFNWEQGRS